MAIAIAGSIAWLIGWRSRSAAPPAAVQRILVVRLDLLGDLALSLPAIWALQRGYPDARIDLLVLPYTAPLLDHYPFIGRVWSFDINRLRPSGNLFDPRQYVALFKLVRALRQARYDLAVTLHGAWGSVFAFLSGAPIRVGYAGESVPHTLTIAVPGRRYHVRRHEAEYCLDLAIAAGGRPGDDLPLPRLQPAAIDRVDALLAEAGIRPDDLLVALHPGATNGSAKRWPPTSFAALADWLVAELGARVVVTGSPGERWLAELVGAACRARSGVTILAGRTTIPDLLALLARCRLVVCGDSAPLHLAGLLGVPAVAIHGPSDPALSGPYRAKAVVVRRSLGCSPCYDLSAPADCPYDNPICMTGLSVAEVIAACRRQLGAVDRARPGPIPLPVLGTPLATIQPSRPRAAPGATVRSAMGDDQSRTATSRRQQSVARVLVVKLADIGDILTITPALRAIRETYPRWHVTALVPERSAAVLAGSPLVDAVLTFDKFAYDRPADALRPAALLRSVRFLWLLRRRRFDRVILFHHLVTRWGAWKFAALALATGAPARLGLDNGRGWFLTQRVPDGGFGGLHEVEYALEIARTWGARSTDRTLALPVSADDHAMAARALATARRPIVAIHPGTGPYAPARRWSLDGFAAVADGLAADGATVVVVGSEAERAWGAHVASAAGDRAIDLTGRTTVGQLGAVLSRCNLFIGSDSGVMHVATAVRTPVLAIFGPSNPAAWGPWTDGQSPARVLTIDLPCRPCLYVGRQVGLRYGCGAMTCLTSITPADVLEAAWMMLREQAG